MLHFDVCITNGVWVLRFFVSTENSFSAIQYLIIILYYLVRHHCFLHMLSVLQATSRKTASKLSVDATHALQPFYLCQSN